MTTSSGPGAGREIRRIQSRDNPLFRELRDLADSPRRRREHRQTLLDGPHLLEEALAAGVIPNLLIFSEGYRDGDMWCGHVPGIPAVELAAPLFRQLVPVDTPQGVLARIDIPAPPARPGDFAVLLEAVQDPGNLGAILRTAAAAGVDSVQLSKGCAEAWSPKALRGGQGAQFRLVLHEDVDLAAWIGKFSGQVLVAAPDAATSLYQLHLKGPLAFLFGNEGAGVSPALRSAAAGFSIPMPGGMESLNVAAAAAVCLFERVRQCQVAGEGA